MAKYPTVGGAYRVNFKMDVVDFQLKYAFKSHLKFNHELIFSYI